MSHAIGVYRLKTPKTPKNTLDLRVHCCQLHGLRAILLSAVLFFKSSEHLKTYHFLLLEQSCPWKTLISFVLRPWDDIFGPELFFRYHVHPRAWTNNMEHGRLMTPEVCTCPLACALLLGKILLESPNV